MHRGSRIGHQIGFRVCDPRKDATGPQCAPRSHDRESKRLEALERRIRFSKTAPEQHGESEKLVNVALVLRSRELRQQVPMRFAP
jgi:hypothetical protein